MRVSPLLMPALAALPEAPVTATPFLALPSVRPSGFSTSTWRRGGGGG